MAHLTIDNLHRNFGSVEALKGVSFSVEQGEFFCLLGASSAGKTTTLRAISGLEELSQGSVTFAGQDMTSAPVQGRGMSMIFQTFALYPHLSIRANLAYPLVREGVDKKSIAQRVSEVAELLRVTHTLDRKPNTLSGGEQQRVAIGRAIVRRPQLLLLDEPLTNLDAKLRHEMRAEFKRLHRELGMTMLYATPDQLEALTMGQRIALIDDGRIVETGTPRHLYAKPSQTFVATMVGSPVINLVPGKINRQNGNCQLTTPFADVDLADANLDTALDTGDEVTLGIRPQDLHVVSEPSNTPGRDPGIAGTVRLTEPLGDVTILDIDVQGSLLKLVLPEEKAAGYNLGQEIDLSFQLSDAHLFMTETGTRVT
jgi:multiple sugar transport system ATP-binding protein